MFQERDIKIKSKEALNMIEQVLKEADSVLNGENKSIAKSAIIGVLSTTAIKGTLLVPNVGIVLAWHMLSNGIANGILSYTMNKRFIETKELQYKEAIKKQNAIVRALKDDKNADKDRINSLQSYNTILQSIITDLEHDLDASKRRGL